MTTEQRTFGLDCRAASEERGGRGTLVREQLRALADGEAAHRFLLYAREPWDGVRLDERFRWILLPGPDPIWHVRAAAHANRRCDAYLSTNSYLTAWFLRIPSVLMVMDMVTFDRSLAPRSKSVWIERVTLPLALHRSSAVVSISAATEHDLLSRFPLAAPKSSVSPLAAAPTFRAASQTDVERVRRRHRLELPYVLTVGTLEPRKNLLRLLEAFTGLQPEVRENVQLVLVGARGWESAELDAALGRHRDSVRVLGFVDESDLPGLYRGARLFAYPSIYEGFGLPVLEAMQAGTVVLTSSVSSLPEVGGDAVIYVEPASVESIREGLSAGLQDTDLRSVLAARGQERAGEFSWARHATDIVSALSTAAL